MMKKYLSIMLLAFGLSQSLYAQNRNQPNEPNPQPEEKRTVVDVNSPVITVSEVLYEDIVEWLKLSKEGKTPGRLNEYLENKSEDQKEVANFLKEYSSDAAAVPFKTRKSTAGTGDGSGGIDPEGPCNCKSIVPSGTTQKSTNPNRVNVPDYDSDNDVDYTFTQQTDGVALNGKLTQEGNKHSATRSFNLEGHYTYRILNLCTQLGQLTDECNCDKFMGVVGEYYVQRNVYSDVSKCFACGSSYNSWVLGFDAYYAYTAEVDVITGGNLTWDGIDSASHKQSAKESYTVNWNNVGDAIGDVFNTITNIADGNYGAAGVSLVDFIGNLTSIQTQSANGDWVQSMNSHTFNRTYKLRANVPRVFVFASAFEAKAEGSGAHLKDFRNDVQVQSFFYFAYEVANQNEGYDYSGNPVATDECCNEDFAEWAVLGNFNAAGPSIVNGSSNWVNQPSILDQYKQNIIDFMRESYSMGKPYNWDVATRGILDGNGELVDLPEVMPGSNVTHGSLYTLNTCGCESFIVDNDGTLGILTPQLILNPNRLCDDFVQLNITNIETLLQLGANFTVEVYDHNGQLVYSGTDFPLNLYEPGVYTILFVDPDSGCTTSAQIEVLPCDGDNEPSNPYDACLQDAISVYPNPVSQENPEVTVKVCLFECNELTSTEIQDIANTYFSADVDFLNLNTGTLITSMPNSLTPTSNPSECFEITYNLGTAAGVSPPTYCLVVITFKNGKQLAYPVLVQ